VGPRVLEGLGEARRLLDELRVAGINYEDVVATLEAEGVQKFADSFKQLLEGINTKRDVFVVYSRTRRRRREHATGARPDLRRDDRGRNSLHGLVGEGRALSAESALPEALPGITRCAPDRC
jgi:hypothetical protein